MLQKLSMVRCVDRSSKIMSAMVIQPMGPNVKRVAREGTRVVVTLREIRKGVSTPPHLASAGKAATSKGGDSSTTGPKRGEVKRGIIWCTRKGYTRNDGTLWKMGINGMSF